jgi:MarR family transcriptional regulator, organic hydroperoxide resistance regulator
MAAKDAVVSEIIDNIRRVFQVVHEQSKKAKRKTGITGPQLWAIKLIKELSPVRVSDLARSMYIHPATVVGILDRLEVNGFVVRKRSKVDKRVVRVELTGKGKKLVVDAPQIAQGLLVVGLERLTLKRLKAISSALDELVIILGAQELPPQMILSPEVNIPRKKKG